jgi:hypothetical protein
MRKRGHGFTQIFIGRRGTLEMPDIGITALENRKALLMSSRNVVKYFESSCKGE